MLLYLGTVIATAGIKKLNNKWVGWGHPELLKLWKKSVKGNQTQL